MEMKLIQMGTFEPLILQADALKYIFSLVVLMARLNEFHTRAIVANDALPQALCILLI